MNLRTRMNLRMPITRAGCGLGLLALLMLTEQAVAHHSPSAFDLKTTRTFEAVVRTWEFSNPHAFLWVYINDASGTPELWGLEGGGAAALIRAGWNKNTVKPGDKVTVDINPLRDGRNGGSLVNLTLADGRKLQSGPLPGAPGNPAVQDKAK